MDFGNFGGWAPTKPLDFGQPITAPSFDDMMKAGPKFTGPLDDIVSDWQNYSNDLTASLGANPFSSFTPPPSSTPASQGIPNSWGLPRSIPAPRMGSRSQTNRPSYGGNIDMRPGQGPVIEFSRGMAPTLMGVDVTPEEFGKRSMGYNKPYADQYTQFAPQTQAGTRALSQAGATMAAGVLPRDVTGQVGRSVASLGFQTGLGGRSGIGRNLTARDLGLTSLQVQAQGANLLAQSSNIAQQAMQAMAPIAPAQALSFAKEQEYYNREIANQNLLSAWASRPLPGQFDITRGQFAGFQPGTYSDTRPLPPGMSYSSNRGLFAQQGNQALRNWQGTVGA